MTTLEALRLKIKGQITKEEYDQLIKQIESSNPRALNQTPEQATDSIRDHREPQLGLSQNNAIKEEDRPPEQHFSTENAVGFTTHTNQAAGESQKARLLSLLKDFKWHDTQEIMERVYKVNENRGNCRIPSRICELRQAGHQIESRRVKGSLWAYKMTVTTSMTNVSDRSIN